MRSKRHASGDDRHILPPQSTVTPDAGSKFSSGDDRHILPPNVNFDKKRRQKCSEVATIATSCRHYGSGSSGVQLGKFSSGDDRHILPPRLKVLGRPSLTGSQVATIATSCRL